MAVIEEFLSNISNFIRSKDAAKLQDWLRVEPPLPDQYYQLAKELQASFTDSNTLEKYVEKLIPQKNDINNSDDDGPGDAWPGFLAFMKEYLEFWRDINFEDLLDTHTQLSGLVNSCITAMSHNKYGILVLPTTIQLSAGLAKLAMTLDKRPDLTRRLRVNNGDDEGRKTLVEGTAESIQRAFTMCLTERSNNRNGISQSGKPDGKKIGIYSFSNMVLKLLFQCHKTRLANQLFQNISLNSPPLKLYPASQRVTYLYYLGRFQFSNNHFFSASECLQEAYNQCHAKCISQRRLILIYLISVNLILGRFPSRALLSRPESVGVLEKFIPITNAIRRGNLVAFKHALGPASGNDRWFFKKGLLLPLLYRAEVLVWRSMARRVFLITYQSPGDPNSRQAPTLDLQCLVVAAQYCQKILEGWVRVKPGADLVRPLNGPIQLMANEGAIYGNQNPDLAEIEAIVANLVVQGLLHGFVSHNLGRYAILGAKQRGGALKAGFPEPWGVIKARAAKGGTPGWVKEARRGATGGVVNLSGIARPVGSGQ